jgi:hypothetical protein
MKREKDMMREILFVSFVFLSTRPCYGPQRFSVKE